MTWSLRHANGGRLITLTQAPEDWQERRQAVSNLARDLRNDGYRTQWAWATEANPRGTGYHVHMTQHGSYVPQSLLQAHWGSIVDIRRINTPAAGVYAVKGAAVVSGYLLKNTQDKSGIEEKNRGAPGYFDHLALNGGRAVHWSRGFLHGLTKREALAQLAAEMRGGAEAEWVKIPAWSRTAAGFVSQARARQLAGLDYDAE